MESKAIPATVQRQKYTPEEQRIREQILAQYSQVELDECEDDDIGGSVQGGGSSSSTTSAAVDSDPIMAKNTNALDVAQLAKERREQAKLDSKAKKDKDKEDRFVLIFYLKNGPVFYLFIFFREKQKKDREEKKEKRKTVKGERRR